MEPAPVSSEKPPNRSSWSRLILGVVAGFVLGSLVSGGYILYLHGLFVAFASTPLLVLVLRTLLTVVGLAPLFYGLVRLRSIKIRLATENASRESGLWIPIGFGAVVIVLIGVYGIASSAALLVFWLTGGIVSAAIVYENSGQSRRTLAAYAAIVIALFAMLGFVSLYAPVEASKHITVEKLNGPIDVNGLRRFIPLMTAYAYASDRIQIPTHRIYPEDSYVYYLGNSSVYNWIIEPEGFWNQLTKSPLGAVFVYGDEYPPRVKLVARPLEWGLHNKRFRLLFFDTLERRIVMTAGLQYKPLLEDNIEVLYNGKIYILVPLVTWKRGLLYSLPVLHGYVIVDEDGNIEVVTGDRLASDPRLQGMPLLPEAVARDWVEAYRYKVGLVGFYLYHNTYVIRDIGTNPQPYLEQRSDGQLYWVFVAEPPGETYSAKYIIYVETSSTSTPRLLFYELPEPAIGISKVESYVKQAHPTYDWGELSIEEPMPTLLNGTLYWKATVTTKDYRGLVSVDIVNAASGEVISLQPRRKVTYLDVLHALWSREAVEKPTTGGLEERIAALERRVAETIKALEEIQRELQELRRLVANSTTGGQEG
ncbi:hypothetical protein [Pyrodictium delaneyi]|uniref:hypothetical protein n=1 Tax=Pyrodictium delaneyi TaxID=1273541 RepID=UPI00214D5E16|nr:hypothetical protein [Pyrodictium delaneyi]